MKAEKVEVYKCSECGVHYKTFEAAEKCCSTKYCMECGAPLPKDSRYLRCDECREKHMYDGYRRMSIKEYEEEYPDRMVCHGDDFYDGIGDCLDYLYGDLSEEDWDDLHFIQGTEPSRIEVDIDRAIEDAEEDFEDSIFDQRGIDELYEYMKEWNKKYLREVFYPAKILIEIPDEIKAEFEY